MLFTNNFKMKNLVVVISTCLIVSCAGRKYPAPIVKIGDQFTPYTEQQRNSLQDEQYRVEKGETLYSIAWRAGIDFRTLAQLNTISPPYAIFPGQILYLSEKGTENANIAVKPTNSGLVEVSSTQEAKIRPSNQLVNEQPDSQKNNKKTIANEKSEEYGKKQADQKLQNAVQKQLVKKDSFPAKVKHWRYPSKGKIIDTYSTKENGNKGIDFGGKLGDPITAAADGKVVYAGSALRGFGNLIIVKHNNDYLSAYAHNRALKVKEQEWVKAGQLIAEMGNSGTDNVKLHFEIRFRGRTVNPLKYLPKK
jgi:lipoprotein NlpD